MAAEIRAAGGEAIANSESVTSLAAVEEMVQEALSKWGRIDAVINPAGILRDRMFHKMSEAEWDAVIAVHLRGAFNVSRATVELFREQGGGSYVHFTSTTALIGNLGQANYGAAKLGVASLSRILAIEGAAKNVRSNVIAPFAWTRMTSSIPITDEASRQRVERMRDGMRSDQVAQLSIALAADGAKDVSGQIFCVRGDEVILFSQPRPVAAVSRADGWTPERLLNGGLQALQHKFTDLGVSASVFPYDPI
jgi:NAD(P)-dependent dehydrogenase (short-subunit alcohol dehydrogenase family)